MSAPRATDPPVEPVGRRRALRTAGRLLAPVLARTARRRKAGVVLLYHRVGPGVDPASPLLPVPEFERHLDAVTSTYEVVALDDMVRVARAGRPLTGLCALTFDDGYRDFLEHAYPVLRRRQVPATHFVVTGCLDSGRPTWNYRLNRLVPALGPPPPAGWKTWLGGLSPQEREDWLGQREQGRAAAEPAMITAADLATVDDRLVRWGSHSASHGMLAGASAAIAADEVAASRSRLRDMDAGPVDHFAYPNGSLGDVARRAALDGQYAAAFAVGQASVHPGADLYGLPRFDVGGRAADELLLETTGLLEEARGARRAVLR